MDQEQAVLEIDGRNAFAVLKQLNDGITAYEKGVSGASGKLRGSFEELSKMLVNVYDRSAQAQERQLKSLEKMAAVAGKSGLEKLNAEQERFIKGLGSNESAIKRATAAYEALKKAQEGSGEHESASQKGFLAARDLFEGRNAYASVEAGKTLLALRGFPAALGATAAGFGVAAVAGYEAAKSLGEYGIRIQDVELRTGLAAKEVGQFAFAAQAVGQDISVVEHLMQGLTSALSDVTIQGEAGRAALKGFDLRDIEGNVRPTSQVLLEISQRLNALPSAFERNKAGMDIFKRGWAEAAPFVLELSEHVKRAKELGLGPEESDVRRWKAYQNSLTEVDSTWEQLKRAVKEPLAATVIVTFKAIGKLAEAFLGVDRHDHKSMSEQIEADQKIDREQEKIYSEGGPEALTKAAKSLGSYLRNSNSLESAQAELSKLKKTYDDARVSAEQLSDTGKILPSIAAQHRKEVEAARVAYEGQRTAVEALTRAESDRRANAEAIRKLSEEQSIKKQYPNGLLPSEQRVLDFAKSNAHVTGPDVKQFSDILLDQRTKESRDALTRGQAAGQRDLLRELNSEADTFTGSDFTQARADILRLMSEGKDSTQEYRDAVKKLADVSNQQLYRDPRPLGEILQKQQDAAVKEFHDGMERQNKQLEADVKASTAVLTASRASQLREAEASIKIGGILNDRNPDDQLRTSGQLLGAQAASVEDKFRQEQAAITAAIQASHGMDASLEDTQQALRIKHASDLRDLQIEFSTQVAQEQRRQFDTIQRAAEGLFETLFNRPAEFGKQLAATVKAAFLKPITEGLSNTVANGLRPIIYGQDGNGGIAGSMKGIFGSKQTDPIKASTDLLKGSTDINSQETNRNTDELRRLNETMRQRETSSGSGPAAAVASSTETHLRRIAESTERSEATSTQTPGAGGFFGGFPSLARTAALGMVSVMGMGGMAAPSFARPLSERVTSSFRPGAEIPSASSLGIPAPYSTPDITETLGGSDMEGLSGRGGFEGIAGGVPYESSPLASSFGGNPAAMLGPGGTAPFAGGEWGGFSSGGSTSAGGGGFLSAIPKLFGGSTSGSSQSGGAQGGGLLGGFRNIASNFKNTDWGGFTHADPGAGADETVAYGPGQAGGQGAITGMHGMAGSLVMAGGTALASRGLMGQDRGTGKGIFEGAAGGAMIGFEMGGPIGAAVGAAVGAGIGVGEKLAGVESDENKAIRLVKDLYRIDINIQTARAIVQLANSKYAHNVNYAIRSPEVRQMLELYSAGTGQAGKMPLSSTTPMGASLVEQGGKLYQGQQYQFGNAYVQQSSLPVAGGGNPSVYPSPTSVQLIVADSTSMGSLLDGRVAQTVNPGFVQDRFAAAQTSSNGRLQNSAMVQAPGLVFG